VTETRREVMLYLNNALIKNKVTGAYFNKDMQGHRKVQYFSYS
jgi:hypothetical protein